MTNDQSSKKILLFILRSVEISITNILKASHKKEDLQLSKRDGALHGVKRQLTPTMQEVVVSSGYGS